MNNPWFRLYHEFATDPKIQMLSERVQRRFVMLLCMKCSNADETLHDSAVTFQLRIASEDWSETKAILMRANLIDKDNQPLAWSKRQFTSDSSTARVRAFREREKNEGNVTVTPPEQNRTEQNRTEQIKNSSKKPAFLLPKDVDETLWNEWMQLRVRLKAVNTIRAKKGLLNRLDKCAAFGILKSTAMEVAITNSWKSIEPHWIKNDEENRKFRTGNKSSAGIMYDAITGKGSPTNESD